jgi:hypothetical protein
LRGHLEKGDKKGQKSPRKTAAGSGVGGELIGGGADPLRRDWLRQIHGEPTENLERDSVQARHRERGRVVIGTLSPGAHPGGFNGQDAYNGQLVVCEGKESADR